MNKYNTQLGQLLALVGRPQFERLVKSTGADKYCKQFSAWQQFAVMGYAHLAGHSGLRSIENSLNSNRTCLYHLGISGEVRRSTISYANANRSCEFYEKLFYAILAEMPSGARKKFRKNFFAVDATTISLNVNDFAWAKFRETKAGVKINVRYDIGSSIPDVLFITNASEHENGTLKKMGLKKGDTAAFDRGYFNYEIFGIFCDEGVQFVTRLKDRAAFEVAERHETRSKSITLDQTIVLTGNRAQKKCKHRLRMITAVDEKTGKEITLLTNMFGVTAEHVARLYRARWSIELFFKALKQNTRIKKFYGQSENAVKTQIWIAMIIYLLYMKLRNMSTSGGKNFTHFVSEISVCLFERKDLFAWFAGGRQHVPRTDTVLQQEFWL